MPTPMSIRQLKETREYFRQNPTAIVRVHTVWPPRDYSADSWQQWFRDCLNAKINSHIAGYGIGRKWQWEYQIKLRRDAQTVKQIKQHRIRHYQFETHEVYSRLSHLLSDPNEF